MAEDPTSNPYDLILIRHGQSDFNRGHLDFLQKSSLQLQWDDCIKIADFNEAVSYAKQHIDSPLTHHGIQQSQKARELLLSEELDIVLVSPYQRALQTCRQIFGNRNLKIQVHPVLAQVFRFACDIGHQIKKKQTQFKHFDFSHMQDASELWFIEHLAPHHQQTWRKHQGKSQRLAFEQKQAVMMSLIKQKVIYQTAQQLRERIWKIKDLLVEYRKKYRKIAVVTHFCVLNTLLAHKFHQNGEIIDPNYILNAHPYFQTVQNLIQYK